MIDWYDANFVLVQGTIINLLLALSLQVPFRFGVFSFAGVGRLRHRWLHRRHPDPRAPGLAVVAILGAMVVGVVVCYVLGLVVARLAGLYLGMATIAFTLIVGVVAINGGLLTGGSSACSACSPTCRQ